MTFGYRNYLLSYLAWMLIVLLPTVGIAKQPDSVQGFIQEMVNDHQFDQFYLTELLAQAKVKKNILKLMGTPVTKKRPWYKYRVDFVTSNRIKKGAEFWQQYAEVLKRAQATYGVPSEIIVSIIGVETIYGQHTGNIRVLDALYTLAFYFPRRADYFRQELKEFLLLCREEGFDPTTLEGSYAGAMGLGQFMPSSYRQLAIDFNNDGKRNIWTDVNDAIGSVANYLKHHGWQPNQATIIATQVSPEAVDALIGTEFELKYTIDELKEKGLLFYGDEPGNQLGVLVDLETEQGMAYWLGLTNFYVITRYNHSTRYAMAVYQLAQEIKRTYYENAE